MAPPDKPAPPKLPRIPNSTSPPLFRQPYTDHRPPAHRISKRPPPRPAIPSPYTSAATPKVVYLTAHTPFHSATKRVRKLLALADKRAVGKVSLLDSKKPDKQKMRALAATVADGTGRKGVAEEVFLRGTGKAIARALELGLWFQGQEGYRVRVKTGTVCAVDDIVERDDVEDAQEGDESMDVGSKEAEEVQETRIRRLSMVEIGVSSTYTPGLGDIEPD